MKCIFTHMWSALPQTFFQSLGEWAGKGNFLTTFFLYLSDGLLHY